MAFVFGSALGAFRAFGEWLLTDANFGDILGIGVIISALAFIYALSHKSTL